MLSLVTCFSKGSSIQFLTHLFSILAFFDNLSHNFLQEFGWKSTALLFLSDPNLPVFDALPNSFVSCLETIAIFHSVARVVGVGSFLRNLNIDLLVQ